MSNLEQEPLSTSDTANYTSEVSSLPEVSSFSIPDPTLFPDRSGFSMWKSNFDRIIANPKYGFFGVIDGAGKTPETWQAARIVRREFQKSLKRAYPKTGLFAIGKSQIGLRDGYMNARENLHQYLDNLPEKDKERLGNFTVETTATIIDFVTPDIFNIFHIGDSRLYIFNKNLPKLLQLTPDQSYLDQQESDLMITTAQGKRITNIMNELQFDYELDYLVLPDGEVVKNYTNSDYRQLLAKRAVPIRNAWENKRFLSSSVNDIGKEKSFTQTYIVKPSDVAYLIMSDGIYENIRESEMFEETSRLENSDVSTERVARSILQKAIDYAKNPATVKRVPDDMSLIIGQF